MNMSDQKTNSLFLKSSVLPIAAMILLLFLCRLQEIAQATPPEETLPFVKGETAADKVSGKNPEPTDILPTIPDSMEWKLVWNDDFDGNELDPAKWTYRPDGVRKDGWWNKNAVSLDGKGTLVLKTYAEDGKVNSGCVITQGRLDKKFGYFVARCKLSGMPGHWAAFWLQTNTQGKVGDEGRDGTEIDIFEKFNHRNKEEVSHNLHWDGYGKEHKTDGKKLVIPGILDGYHTFAVWWKPDEYVFYIDGRETWRTKAGGVSQVPQYMMLSDEVAKHSGKLDTANLPDFFYVDYVRVYEPVQRKRLETQK